MLNSTNKIMLITTITVLPIILLIISYYSLTNSKIIINQQKVTTSNSIKRYLKYQRFLEYPNKCNDVHIFTMINEEREQKIHKINQDNVDDGGDGGGSDSGVGGCDEQSNNNDVQNNNLNNENNLDDEKRQRSVGGLSDSESSSDDNDNVMLTKIQSKSKQPNQQTTTTSNPVVYVFLLFLILSLIKAAIDFSKQFKELNTPGNENFSRRCSLQEFAQSRHSRKNSTKKIISSSHTSRLLQFTRNMSLNSNVNATTATITTNTLSSSPVLITNSNTTLMNEPDSPGKVCKLLGGRPVPLIRRSSVPVSMGQQILYNNIGRARRPSMDSFSESGDSSPDVKRRVRMIHRH